MTARALTRKGTALVKMATSAEDYEPAKERSTSPPGVKDEQPTHQQDSQAEEGKGTAEHNRKTDEEMASLDRKEIVKALEVVQRDFVAIAQSFTSLGFSPLGSLSGYLQFG